jgi:hypothetical protein
MATTQYQIFCRYLNEAVGVILTNQSKADYESLCIIETDGSSETNLKHYETIIEQSTHTNPKYDMVFMYDGLEKVEEDNINYLYFDKMKRVKLDPWFLFSSHASLESAMIKARSLVNTLGKEAVKIGKVVPLDQYIEIV